MKKSLSKILARMAKDGDIETVAEIIEEMIEEPSAPAEAVAEGEASTTAGGGNFVEAEVIRNEQAPQGGAATIENAETVIVDESTLAEVISRLDKLIELLTPAPAADEDPVEEIAEAVEEALEAVAEEQEGPVVIPDEDLPEGTTPEEVAEIIEEILDPVTDECGDPEEQQEVLTTGDALRTALRTVRPALAKMPRRQRQRVCADIAARLKKANKRSGSDAGVYAAIAKSRRNAGQADDKALGLKIMAARNANCRK